MEPKTKVKARPSTVPALGFRTPMQDRFVEGRLNKAERISTAINQRIDQVTQQLNENPHPSLVERREQLRRSLRLAHISKRHWEEVYWEGYGQN
jgi:hypothetical protein